MTLVLECPWNVESLEDFLYYCCPECPEKNQNRNGFLCHALEYHPISNSYLMQLEVKQEIGEEKFITDFTEKVDFHASNFKVKEENIIQDDTTIEEDDEEYFPDNSHDFHENYGFKEETENNSDEFKCDQCDKEFKSKSGLDYHLDFFHGEDGGEELNDDPKPFKCNLCKWKGRKKKFLDKHFNIVHKKIRNCDFCGKTLVSKEYDDHIQDKHVQTDHEGNKYFKCDSCDKLFTEAATLRKHIKTVHEGLKDFKCDSCARSFACSTHLRRHIEKIHEKIFPCDYCDDGKQFMSKQDLHDHIDEFHDEFKCPNCGKCFKNKFKLAIHMKNKHTKLKYKCDYDLCEKSFSSHADLKDHRAVDHKDDAKKFSCQFCQKSFNVKRYLDDHIRITHEGNKFECEECKYLFFFS